MGAAKRRRESQQKAEEIAARMKFNYPALESPVEKAILSASGITKAEIAKFAWLMANVGIDGYMMGVDWGKEGNDYVVPEPEADYIMKDLPNMPPITAVYVDPAVDLMEEATVALGRNQH